MEIASFEEAQSDLERSQAKSLAVAEIPHVDYEAILEEDSWND